MDVVYVVREAAENEPLRYSLRSLRHIDHDRVWIAGHRPEWVRNVGHIPTVQNRSYPENSRLNVWAACTHPEVSTFFSYWNDDFFALRDTDITPGHLGPLSPVPNLKPNSASWRDGRDATRALLASWGIDPVLSYEGHRPMVFHKERMLATLARADGSVKGLHYRTAYGNLYQLGGERRVNAKIRNKNDLPDPSWDFVSSSPRAWDGNLGSQIRSMFADPSPYEDS